MKNIKQIVALLFLTVSLNSCGLNMALFTSKNSNVTHVELSRKNFKVLERVTGTASATYYFNVGGMKNKDLINMATADMVAKANLTGTSKALVNTTIDIHKGGICFLYSKITVTVSAQVIEFTE